MSETNDFIEKYSKLSDSYFFYQGKVELKFDPEEHVYLLVSGENLVPQVGVTNVTHKAIDKSDALIPWGVKMMAEKLIRLMNETALDTPELYSIAISKFEELVKQAKSAHKEKLDEAGLVGHQAHSWLEKYIYLKLHPEYIAENPMPQDERAKNCCIAALAWEKNHNVRWHCTERKVYSRLYEYAGTMDGLATVDSCENPLCCPKPFKDHLSVIDWKTSNYLYIEYLFQTAAYQNAYVEEFDAPVKDRWILRLGKDDAEFEAWYLPEETYREDFVAWLQALSIYRSIESVQTRMKIKKDWLKYQKKQESKVLKDKQLAIKCKKADTFKGTRFPKCNGGDPCQTCLQIYNERQKVVDKPIEV